MLERFHIEAMEVSSLQSRSPDSSTSDKSQSPKLNESRPRKRHRRGKHRRRWKPYSKMTTEEKKELEARETARAAKREADLKGKPAAPWNTTQFIIEDRGSTEVRLPCPRTSRTTSVESSPSDGEYYKSSEEEIVEHGLYLEQDFESAYQEVAREHLQGLSKSELVQQCLQLEEELTEAKERVNIADNASAVLELQHKLNELQSDNQRLKDENEKLRNSQSLNKLQVSCPVNSC